jgi:hypothetical protein
MKCTIFSNIGRHVVYYEFTEVPEGYIASKESPLGSPHEHFLDLHFLLSILPKPFTSTQCNIKANAAHI